MVMHSFADDPAGQYYGPSSLMGSRLIRIASSLHLCPKVIGIDYPTKRSCVLQVVLRQRIKKIEVMRQRIKKMVGTSSAGAGENHTRKVIFVSQVDSAILVIYC